MMPTLLHWLTPLLLKQRQQRRSKGKQGLLRHAREACLQALPCCQSSSWLRFATAQARDSSSSSKVRRTASATSGGEGKRLRRSLSEQVRKWAPAIHDSASTALNKPVTSQQLMFATCCPAGIFTQGKLSSGGALKLSGGLSRSCVATTGEATTCTNGINSSMLFHDQPDGASTPLKQEVGGAVQAAQRWKSQVTSGAAEESVPFNLICKERLLDIREL